MGDKASRLRKLLKDVIGYDPMLPLLGTVEAIDGRTCSVKLESGLVVSDVRLTATVSDDEDTLELTPAIGSEVMMISGDGSLRNLTVVKCDKIQRFKMRMGNTALEIGEDGKISAKVEDVSLHDVFVGLKTALDGFTVNTTNGPSTGLMPQTVTALNQFETKFKQVLK